jgi:outer membrane immunogenic protein
VRGRLGVTFSPVLLYVTGGLAYGEIETNGTLTNVVPVPFPFGLLSTSFGHSVTKSGWTVGAGIEGRLWDNWTGKIEYLYMDLGTVSGSIVPGPPGPAPGARGLLTACDVRLRRGSEGHLGASSFAPSRGSSAACPRSRRINRIAVPAPRAHRAPASARSG